MQFQDEKDLKEKLDKAGGVMTVAMQELRDLFSFGRLGIHVRNEISKRLDAIAIAHYPSELPAYQHEFVRLYRRGSEVSDLIQAVLNVGEDQDRKIREVAQSDASDILGRVRALVCE